MEEFEPNDEEDKRKITENKKRGGRNKGGQYPPFCGARRHKKIPRHKIGLKIPNNSFRHSVVDYWNSFPKEIVNGTSLNRFELDKCRNEDEEGMCGRGRKLHIV